MKELTIEQKAQRYDKALAKARAIVNSINVGLIGKDSFEAVFPELKENKKESTDEKVRKALIKLVTNHASMDLFIEYDIHLDEALSWLEKQGERKPADKIEPKFNFKDGQWIVATGKCIYLITKIDGFNVTLVDVKDNEYVFDTSSLENAHLWNIRDAKDGDVVVDKSDGAIGIFQSIGHHPDGGSYNDPSYCFLHCRYDNGFFYADFEHGNTIDSDDLIPATKEQRDTLMKAMADAGYTFDFEKRELKKIEQPHTWSEEDEHWRQKAIDFMKHPDLIKATPTLSKDTIDWLKSLKPQPKQEWSKDDEEIVEALNDYVKNLDILFSEIKIGDKDILSKEFREKVQLWLGSLRPQSQWRPSRDQMDALDIAIRCGIQLGSWEEKALKSLREQLFKL